MFIALGALFNLIVESGAPGLRENNPSIATIISAFTFPIGFVLIILANVELVTSNFFVMIFTTLQRKTTPLELIRVWVVSYVGNVCGALFFSGFLTWWTQTLESEVEQAFTILQAEGRVNINSYWSVNFLRGVGCNILVGLAFFLSAAADDYVSKIYCIWIPIWGFVVLGYQHSIANCKIWFLT